MPQPTPTLLIRPAAAAELLSISRRTLYDLIQREPRIRAAVVEIPGLRGMRLRRDLLEAAIAELTTPIAD